MNISLLKQLMDCERQMAQNVIHGKATKKLAELHPEKYGRRERMSDADISIQECLADHIHEFCYQYGAFIEAYLRNDAEKFSERYQADIAQKQIEEEQLLRDCQPF